MLGYLICAPSYNPNNGGSIVLHSLCNELNDCGCEAYLVPYEDLVPVSTANMLNGLTNLLKFYLKLRLNSFRTYPSFNTPVKRLSEVKKDIDQYIVVYPEIVFGNPFGASHIVRWLLHQPDFHKGYALHRRGDYYVKYNSAIAHFNYFDNEFSNYDLKVVHYPTDIYKPPLDPNDRKGEVYCVRKGRNRPDLVLPSNAVVIDDMPHADIALLFQKAEKLISFDTYTAYSRFAALCGCDSIVVPEKGVDKLDWYIDEKDRYGIAYGFEEQEQKWMQDTRRFVNDRIQEEKAAVRRSVLSFIKDTQERFKCI
jgi:hypothetical protein